MDENNLLDLIIVKRQFNAYIRKLKLFLFLILLLFFIYKIQTISKFIQIKSSEINHKIIEKWHKIDDDFFSIKKENVKISITGNNYYKKENIINLIQNSKEININLTLLTELKKELESKLLIKKFTIKRIKFLNMLKINIEEEEILANYINESSTFFLLDDLSILKIPEEELNKYNKHNINIIDKSASNHLNLKEDLRLLLKKKKIKNVISEINILENERINLILKNYNIILKLPFNLEESLIDKIEEMLIQYKEKLELIDAIDARVESKIYIIFKNE